MSNVARKVVLTVAENKLVTNFVNKYGLALGAKRFVAGEKIDNAINAIKQLNAKGISATLDNLGESCYEAKTATDGTMEAIRILEVISDIGVDSNLSVKLTQLGLDIDQEFCLSNLMEIVGKANELDNFVRIDMEDSSKVDATIAVFRELKEKYPNNVGLALQSYLYRTEKDMDNLSDLKPNFRLMKGAYNEPKEVAFPLKKDVDDNLVKIIKKHLDAGFYTAIASHDENIINISKDYISKKNIPTSQYEFQMLYGICSNLQEQLVREGHKVRCYVPYGTDWYPYFSRRLAERPANIVFILKNLLKK
ncbi:MAG: proline dehydrogenase [Desulfitibacter sp. BRH_c19]|nr:MAG: proline dehydrogenase [Desulfitibacter sp. BRH_c19]